MAGLTVLMAATTRLVEPARHGLATGIVNAGGSSGQFVYAPLALGISAAAGWVVATQSLGFQPPRSARTAPRPGSTPAP